MHPSGYSGENDTMKIQVSCSADMFEVLPKPQLARRVTPDWYKDMPMEQALKEGGTDLTLKHCMPFIDALTAGIGIPLQADVTVKDSEFSWDWPFDESPMGFHFPTQAPGVPFVENDEVVVKVHNFWNIHTDPGYATLFSHPFNRLELPFRTLTGLVDTDSYDALPVHFPVVWIDPTVQGVLPAGTQVAQCLPIKRDKIELDVVSMNEEEFQSARTLKNNIKIERSYYKNHIRRPRS